MREIQAEVVTEESSIDEESSAEEGGFLLRCHSNFPRQVSVSR